MYERNLKSLDPASGLTLTDKIHSALKGLRYGSVEIIVHDGRVVQIERKERWRTDFDNPSLNPKER